MRFVLVSIFGILFLSLFSIVVVNSFTNTAVYSGAYSANYVYGPNKLYGGGFVKALEGDSPALGHNYMNEVSMSKFRGYLIDNKDKWDCSFGVEALDSPEPCFFDDSIGKYCCVPY